MLNNRRHQPKYCGGKVDLGPQRSMAVVGTAKSLVDLCHIFGLDDDQYKAIVASRATDPKEWMRRYEVEGGAHEEDAQDEGRTQEGGRDGAAGPRAKRPKAAAAKAEAELPGRVVPGTATELAAANPESGAKPGGGEGEVSAFYHAPSFLRR